MIFRRRDPNKFRWRRGVGRNGHGDIIVNGVFICGGEMAEGFVPPPASLDPDAHRASS